MSEQFAKADDMARSHYVACLAHAGGHVKNAHEAAQENRFDDAAADLESAVKWIGMAGSSVRDLKPFPPEIVERIISERRDTP